ncbi:MAG: VOC family protein [Acidobacteriota bacterium]
MPVRTLFHLAFPVNDLAAARGFYGDVLGCTEGRSSDRWVDFDLFGHQIVAHLVEDSAGTRAANQVDADNVPIPHFGMIMQMEEWQAFADKLVNKGVKFLIEPRIRFAGEVGEQATMFFVDPSGNALEFKGFTDFSSVFAN